jgi:hypothetical protein
MTDTPTLTIRIPPDVREALDRASMAADQSATEFVVRALRMRIAGMCSACGREGGAPASPLPGMTPAFEGWLQKQLRSGGESHEVVIATSEGAGRVYVGRFTRDSIHDTYVTLGLKVGKKETVLVPVARAHVVMWEAGEAGRYMGERLVQLFGYQDVRQLLSSRAAFAGPR